MKAQQIILAILAICVASHVAAAEIALPADLNAQAFVVKADKNGLWEKPLFIQFPQKRHVLSTNDGLVDVAAIVNHSAHAELWNSCGETKGKAHGCGAYQYLKNSRAQAVQRLGVKDADIALLGTAADMDNLAVVTKTFKPFVVTALVTAGAKGNAIRTGVDEGKYIEPDPAFETTQPGNVPKPGTVNILILTNAKFTDGGLARAIITATEAKTAAFEDLKVPSTYTKTAQATGTGTDGLIVVSGVSGPLVTYPGGHSRIGELLGKAVHEAVMEALEKQNGFKRPRK